MTEPSLSDVRHTLCPPVFVIGLPTVSVESLDHFGYLAVALLTLQFSQVMSRWAEDRGAVCTIHLEPQMKTTTTLDDICQALAAIMSEDALDHEPPLCVVFGITNATKTPGAMGLLPDPRLAPILGRLTSFTD